MVKVDKHLAFTMLSAAFVCMGCAKNGVSEKDAAPDANAGTDRSPDGYDDASVTDSPGTDTIDDAENSSDTGTYSTNGSDAGNSTDTSHLADAGPEGDTEGGLDAGSDSSSIDCSDAPCDEHATCDMEAGQVTCTCSDGWQGDGYTCEDVNECLTDNGGCPYYYDCINEPGNVSCVERDSCIPGFTGTPGTGCQDINECATDNGGCDGLTPCINKPGGYECGDCPMGYEGDGETGCVDVNADVSAACVVYVDAALGNDDNSGSSWAGAKLNLYAGIETAALNGCATSEVWATAGTYYTTLNYRDESTIQMVDGVNVYGGFIGNETSRAERDYSTNQSIISGNIRDLEDETDNACWVVSGTENSVIDGFTIRDAYGYDDCPHRGGGMEQGVAVNCTFTENQGRSGAGMYDGVATNCTFRSNYADEGAGMFGGIATNCLFDSNTAIEEGGGMYSGMGHSYLPEFETVATNSLFVSNSARAGGGMFGGTAVNSTFDSNTASSGGGLYDGTAIDSVFLRNSAHSGGGMNGTESHVATNCRFERNSAEEYGGGIYEATANKCTFISNTARVGGGIYGGRPTDCLFFSNTASSWGGGLHASYIEARRCTFVANSAGMYGGGMYEGTATDCTFMSNSADTGGGLHSGIAERCVFASNFADTSGGGTHDSRLINSILVSNGTNGEGGGMYEGNAANCTFVSNTSPNYGQGATEAHVANCIFGNGPADGLDRTYCAQADGVDELAAIFNGFPLLTGTWSSVSFDDTAYQTTLVTPEGSFEENELVGLFVQPDTTQPWWFEIASNTTDTIVVLADLRTNRDGDDFVQEGDAYQLYDLHLKDDSPCIDAGSHSQAPFQDKEGVYRTDNPNVPNSGAGPYWADQGAYESGDGKDAVCGAPIVHSHYYYVCEGERTAQDAAAYCARLGFDNHHLVTLESSAENEFVTSLTDRVLWIGAAEGGDEGEWSWQSDGSWGNFLNWEDEYPQTDFQVSCAIMGDNPDRQWRDVPCTEEHFFICELYGG